MKKSSLSLAALFIFTQIAYANDIYRIGEIDDFIRIHETLSNATDLIRKSNIQSIMLRNRNNNWLVYVTTSEFGSIDRVDSSSNRIYKYSFLTQSRAESFANQLIEVTAEEEPPR